MANFKIQFTAVFRSLHVYSNKEKCIILVCKLEKLLHFKFTLNAKIYTPIKTVYEQNPTLITFYIRVQNFSNLEAVDKFFL